MAAHRTVLLLGATGRTGRHTLEQLLDRGIRVRTIVRGRERLPPALARHPGLEVTEASLLELPEEVLQRHVAGCEAVISCLGHPISFAGVFGPPRDLVRRATARVCAAIRALAPQAPIKVILMSSVSVYRPGAADARRGALERAFLGALRAVLPPAADNQRAADDLVDEVGKGDAFVQWVVVRPDSLREGEVSAYAVHEGIVDRLFAPGETNMANVAHFLCELTTDAKTWAAWKGRLPVIVNDGPRG